MKTLSELGRIMLDQNDPDAIREAYNVDPSDLEEVGRQALAWGDINEDGSIN